MGKNCNDLCRICLQETRSEMKSLLDPSDEIRNIWYMFESVTKQQLNVTDSTPYRLCKECEENLNCSYNFQKQCLRANEFIKNYCSTSAAEHHVSVTTANSVASVVSDPEEDFSMQCDEEEEEADEDEAAEAKTIKEEPLLYDAGNLSEGKCEFGGPKKRLDNKNFTPAQILREIEEIQKNLNAPKKCILCPYKAKVLNLHMFHEHKEVKNWCLVCNETVEERLYDEHMKAHLKDKVECKFCNKQVRPRYLVDHLKLHAGVEPLVVCPICQITFSSRRYLKSHLIRNSYCRRLNEAQNDRLCEEEEDDEDGQTFKTEPSDEDSYCGTCEKSFDTTKCLKDHLRRNSCCGKLGARKRGRVKMKTEDAREAAAIKDEEEENAERLKGSDGECAGPLTDDDDKNAVVAGTKIKLHFCTRCKKTVGDLGKHMEHFHLKSKELPPEKKTFTCDICQKVVGHKTALRIHIKTHENEDRFKCSHCHKRCKHRQELIEHERVHTGERPNICSVCGKGFKQVSSLRTHMLIHGERPLPCSLCEKRYCTKAELRLHMRSHTGEKPFLCTVCGKGFKQKGNLTYHSKMHSDETPYQCNLCSKAFKLNYSLKLHLKTHSDFKELHCPYCSYACHKRYNLKQHMKRHSVLAVQEQHCCQICGNSFTTKGMLKTHMTSVHNAIL